MEMEILGSTFDDSVFEESRDKVANIVSSYNAKFCEPQWYFGRIDTDDILEKQKIHKFRADFAFRRNHYQKALNEYRICLTLVPDGNITIRRDVLEAMARCCCHLGMEDQTLEITEKLRKEASNTCHLTCILLLELNIHERSGDVRSKIMSLQQLCTLHPYNHWHWMKLAMCYQNLFLHPSTSSNGCPIDVGDVAQQQAETAEGRPVENNKDTWLKACMCFVRTRLLLRLLRNQQSSFVLQRSERALQETERALQSLELKERTLQLISEGMEEDLLPDRLREESQDGESLAGLCFKDFEEKWWNRQMCQQILEQD